ncbi:hypothetical protein L2E82_51471 [Cichorium intybus]|nr:hypothetical protein L2E82_51471 [Cichorium intybus]
MNKKSYRSRVFFHYCFIIHVFGGCSSMGFELVKQWKKKDRGIVGQKTDHTRLKTDIGGERGMMEGDVKEFFVKTDPGGERVNRSWRILMRGEVGWMGKWWPKMVITVAGGGDDGGVEGGSCGVADILDIKFLENEST